MIYNIFRKNKKKNEKKNSKIIIDIHEKNSLVPSYLKELQSEIEFKDLKIGDYLINNIIIERKTDSDFISSMINKRLTNQLKSLKKYKKRILIIEGLEYEKLKNRKINPNAIKGFLVSISINKNIPIIQTKDSFETAGYLNIIAKQQTKEQENKFHKKIAKNREEQKNYILQSFPKIGPIKSKKLLKEFNNLKEIFNSEKQNLEKILGNRTQEFIDLLESPNKVSNLDI